MLHYRTIWISDTHLGAREAKAEYLLDFFTNCNADTIYLVGDILDLWKLRSWYWPESCNRLVQLMVERARLGTRVVYIPGNHDERLRDFIGCHFSGIEIQQQAIHQGADGRRHLVLHGDEFDCVVMHNKWLAHLGDKGYEALLRLSHWFNQIRRRLGFPYWSLSLYIKQRVKEAVNYIGNFEQAVVDAAERHGVQGIVCGHIHHAAIRTIAGVDYHNCGDWVESCTALVEEANGAIQVIDWTQESGELLERAARQGERRPEVLQPAAA